MKYEFSEERSKRKKRNKLILGFLIVVVLAILMVVFNYFAGEQESSSPEITSPPITETIKPEDKVTSTDKVENKKDDSPVEKVVQQEQPAPRYTIHINKGTYLLTVLENEQVVNTYPIAIGKNPGQKQRSGDLTTPTGDFTVDEILDASYWTHDFKDGKGEIAGAYGPWFISLQTGWDGIGIHGTHDPASIGTMVSEGCIRMNNSDLLELVPKAVVGTKVIIEE